MTRKRIRSFAIGFATWLPFCTLWVLFAMSTSRERLSTVLLASLISTGSAGLLGIGVWHVCGRIPWPLRFSVRFYALQIVLGLVYATTWTALLVALESLRGGSVIQNSWSWGGALRQLLIGFWYYAVFAGISYAVQTRIHLHEKETLALRAEAMATAARLDALRARLNPHFLFNALHTLNALVKFKPMLAEGAIQRLGDMLRYTLKEDGRELVEFSEEYEFTRQYLAFEQLRYEERLRCDLQIDPESFTFDVPPFSMQTLAENAVHHAIAVRPEGGWLSITSCCKEGRLEISVRDDGPGEAIDAAQSHRFGLHSLRERLRAAYAGSTELRVKRSESGFEATLVIPKAPSEG